MADKLVAAIRHYAQMERTWWVVLCIAMFWLGWLRGRK